MELLLSGPETLVSLVFILILFLLNLATFRQGKKSAAELMTRIDELERRFHDLETGLKAPAAEAKILTQPPAHPAAEPLEEKAATAPELEPSPETAPEPEPQQQAVPEPEEKPLTAPATEAVPEPAPESKPAVINLGPDPKRPETNLARCGNCDHKLAYKTLMSGKRVKCPSCQTPLSLP